MLFLWCTDANDYVATLTKSLEQYWFRVSHRPFLHDTLEPTILYFLTMVQKRVCHDCISCCVPKRVRRWVFSVLLVVISVVSLVFQRTLLLNVSTHTFNALSNTLLTNPSQMESKNAWHNKDEDESVAACKLPKVDPFHPSVLQFIEDLGKLHCEGANYSSFENNVLRVEGEDIVSAEYRKIERAPGDDFSVVLSDPVRVRNTSGNRNPVGNYKGW